MEWVIAALAMGCVFFIVQVVVDYYRYRSVVGPRMDRLEETRAELERRLQRATAELERRRGEMNPLRGQVDELERQRAELERHLDQARGGDAADLPVRRRPQRGASST